MSNPTVTPKWKIGQSVLFNRCKDPYADFSDEVNDQIGVVSSIVVYFESDGIEIRYHFSNIDDGCDEKFIIGVYKNAGI